MLGVTEAPCLNVIRVFAGLPSGILIDNPFFRILLMGKIHVNFLFNHRKMGGRVMEMWKNWVLDVTHGQLELANALYRLARQIASDPHLQPAST